MAIGDSSTGGLIDDLLLPPYHSGVLQRPTRKNYVMHPTANQKVIELEKAIQEKRAANELPV